MEQYMPFIWLGIALLMGVLEVSTSQLISVWFVLGALGGAVTCIFTDNIIIQIAVFVAVSVLSLIVTRPFVNKIKKVPQVATNADMNIGKVVKVIKDIDNSNSTGEVKIDDVIWTARTLDNSVVKKGEEVVIKSIEGIKLMVLPVTSSNSQNR